MNTLYLTIKDDTMNKLKKPKPDAPMVYENDKTLLTAQFTCMRSPPPNPKYNFDKRKIIYLYNLWIE